MGWAGLGRPLAYTCDFFFIQSKCFIFKAKLYSEWATFGLFISIIRTDETESDYFSPKNFFFLFPFTDYIDYYLFCLCCWQLIIIKRDVIFTSVFSCLFVDIFCVFLLCVSWLIHCLHFYGNCCWLWELHCGNQFYLYCVLFCFVVMRKPM